MLVEQPTAAGAARNRGGGLDVLRTFICTQTRDKAFVQGQLESLRCTDGIDALADSELAGCAQDDGWSLQIRRTQLTQVAVGIGIVQHSLESFPQLPHL